MFVVMGLKVVVSFINKGVVRRVMDEQGEVQQVGKVRRFIRESIRVIHVTRKPTLQEYKNLLKVTGIGVLILGAMGFVIFLIKELLIK